MDYFRKTIAINLIVAMMMLTPSISLASPPTAAGDSSMIAPPKKPSGAAAAAERSFGSIDGITQIEPRVKSSEAILFPGASGFKSTSVAARSSSHASDAERTSIGARTLWISAGVALLVVAIVAAAASSSGGGGGDGVSGSAGGSDGSVSFGW